MQIPKHVAGGKSRDQELFRIVACRISPEGGIAGARNLGLSLGNNCVIPSIAAIGLGALAGVARPIHSDVVSVLFHCLLLIGLWDAVGSCSRIHASETFRPFAMSSTTRIN